MKTLLTIAVLIIVVLAGLLLWQSKQGLPKTDAGASAPAAVEAASRVTKDTNGDTIIRLDANAQEVIGLQATNLQALQLTPETKAFGRVMDPVTLSATVSDLLSARAAAEVSRKELDRLKILSTQSNASTRAVEAADGAAQRDAALTAAAHARLTAVLGEVMANDTSVVTLVKSLAAGESALVILNSPDSTNASANYTNAILVPFSAKDESVEARWVGSPLAIDWQTQTRGLLFLVADNHSRLAPGEAVTGFLKSAGAAVDGFLVPRNAIIRFNGASWIYAQIGGDEFKRLEVKLRRPLADGWLAELKINPESKVVIVGAQQLLSEELKGQLSGD